MKRIVLIEAFAVSSLLPLGAQNDGGISDGMLQRIRASYEDTPADRALRNAICNNDIRKLVVNQPNQGEIDTYFSHRVPSKGVTDQQQSGRCWLFSGLNVLRARMIARYGLGAFEFSQNYCFFWDQLEKANLFLQGVIDTRDAPREDRTVEWLFKNPLSDGGQFTGVADIVGKYGLVPKEAMPETYSSEHTAQMAALLKLKLREYGLSLREAARDGAEKAELESRKTEMLGGDLPDARAQSGRAARALHVDAARCRGASGRYARIHAEVVFRNLCRRRSHGQLCHADERSHARLLQVL